MNRFTPVKFDTPRESSAARGYGAGWRRLRLMVLRDEPLCRECTRDGRTTPAAEVDHIDGNVHNLALDNLQPLCKRCHSAKTVREQGGLGHAAK